MNFWNRRTVYLGDLAGWNMARRILRENGIATEEQTMPFPDGISEDTRRRMDSLGQTYDRDAVHALYVHRRDYATACRLLGKQD